MDVLDPIWMFWSLYECFGACMDVLDPIWMFWMLYGCFGPYMNVLEPVWMFWSLYECFGAYINVLEPPSSWKSDLSPSCCTVKQFFYIQIFLLNKARIESYTFIHLKNTFKHLLNNRFFHLVHK